MPIKEEQLEVEPNKKKLDEEEQYEVTAFQTKLVLDDQQKKALVDEMWLEFEAIKKERDELQLESKWDSLDRQYDGKVKEDPDRQFNLHKPVTKIKIDAIVNSLKKAFFESDPIYNISPRPEFQREGGQDVCDKQTDFIDYKIDEVIPLKPPMELVFHSAALKGTGFLRIDHKVLRQKRMREESYDGTPEVQMVRGQPQKVNKGLQQFLKSFGETAIKYKGYIKRLVAGKKIEIVVRYKDTCYNDPFPKYVDLKNLYIRLNTEGYAGMKETRLIVERESYTGWELEKKEAKGEFENIDKILKINESDDNKNKDYLTEEYDILRCTYYYKKENEKEESKIVFWVGEEKKEYVGGIQFPYYTVDCDYVPFYVKKKKPGIYGESIGSDLTDSNIAQDEFINLILEAMYMATMITPITDSDEIESQFLEKRWTHGVPLKKKASESLDFLQKYIKEPNVGGVALLMQILGRDDDDVSKISSLMTGKESMLDPKAPGNKVLALIEQGKVNIQEYVLTCLPSFNELASIFLNIYYQISKEGREYRLKAERVTGGKLFDTISRQEMVARTNIQAQAASFNFEKMNEKREDLALYQVMRQELLIARNPEAVYFLDKQLIKGWSKKWKNLVDKLLPPLDQFKKQQFGIALQAVGQYFQMVNEKAQITGQKPQYDAQQLVALVNDLQSESVTPPSPEVLKEREQNAKARG